ncbi:MAG: Na+/H+ antiporter NhaC family protein [Treponemataceae bacterium]|nr:Na+/H+ antiporter NhaC family protein [Treponemataceae bacterium]
MTGTFWSLVPAVVAIALALISKEVYSSLFIGILLGGLFYAGASFSGFLDHVVVDGFIGQLADAYNVGILIFLVILGILVALMNKAGGSAAFGNWAKKHIKTKVGAQLATIFLGIFIFIDDYFNCLTVGSVMKPVTDKHGISKEKLAYLIDSTAAPICIIAPISSWAAAVAGFVTEGENGIALFIKAIPYNFYALLTIVMMLSIVILKCDFGSMAKFEALAQKADDLQDSKASGVTGNGTVVDLIVPIVVLIISCVIGMIYSGGFFGGDASGNFIEAFANCDASVGLTMGAFMALIITLIIYCIRGTLPFKACMECVPEGFKAMVPAILILTLAWTLKSMTDALGAKEFVADLVQSGASGFMNFLPALIFVIAAFLAFATGTSWGTFGILIPICIAVFPDAGDSLRIISISACMAGAVCGDHCSPISDTTIMASAGSQCNHVNHVSSQLPYSLTVAAVSFVCYIIAGFIKNPVVPLVLGVAATIAIPFIVRKLNANKVQIAVEK